jgi:hypothetical protein
MSFCQHNQFFSMKDPDEIIPLSIDFTELPLLDGEVIDSCLFEVELLGSGTEDSSMIVGSADISQDPIVSQVIQGGHDGSLYLIRAIIVTSLGYTRVGSGLLQVKHGGAA